MWSLCAFARQQALEANIVDVEVFLEKLVASGIKAERGHTGYFACVTAHKAGRRAKPGADRNARALDQEIVAGEIFLLGADQPGVILSAHEIDADAVGITGILVQHIVLGDDASLFTAKQRIDAGAHIITRGRHSSILCCHSGLCVGWRCTGCRQRSRCGLCLPLATHRIIKAAILCSRTRYARSRSLLGIGDFVVGLFLGRAIDFNNQRRWRWIGATGAFRTGCLRFAHNFACTLPRRCGRLLC